MGIQWLEPRIVVLRLHKVVSLLINPIYILTLTDITPWSIVEVMAESVGQLGSKLYYSSPESHDVAMSWISHLPVMVSASLLIAACMEESDSKVLELAQNLASSGFRDTSRVGGGNPNLGVMMAQYNRQALLTSIKQYRQQIDEVIDTIEKED